jgi:putative ABC transport system permease protein
MSFIGLLAHNLWTRKVRTLLTAIAVAIGVMTVVTLGVVTHSLKQTAGAVLQTGNADFTVAQKGVSDTLSSVIDDAQIKRIAAEPGVGQVVGALISSVKLNNDTPFFLEIGLAPTALDAFGVTLLSGRPFGATATHEVLLGWRAAQQLDKHVGDSVTIDKSPFQIVGIFQTGQALGDDGSMFPLIPFQAAQRQPGNVTLAFVRVTKGTPIQRVRNIIERNNPNLATVRLASEFGRVDRNIVFIDAADTGATYLALIIGAIIVMNTMLLSFLERAREFGVLRAVGWSRRRLVLLVLGEAVLMALLGAVIGVALSFGVTRVLQDVSGLRGVLHADFTADIFWRALYTAGGIGFLAALYPASRAARLEPLTAMRRE